jgi:hypothetical protein
MKERIVTGVAVLASLLLICGCSQIPQEPSKTTPPQALKTEPSVAPAPVYDLKNDDITQVPEITSLNIAVEGVKLDSPTREVDKLLGKPLKTTSSPKFYRCAYRNYGLYLDIDRYAGKVASIYINANYGKKLKGGLTELLEKGNIETLKKFFGDNPVKSEPETDTTLWEYPQKGIDFVALKQDGEVSYSLKLVAPKK